MHKQESAYKVRFFGFCSLISVRRAPRFMHANTRAHVRTRSYTGAQVHAYTCMATTPRHMHTPRTRIATSAAPTPPWPITTSSPSRTQAGAGVNGVCGCMFCARSCIVVRVFPCCACVARASMGPTVTPMLQRMQSNPRYLCGITMWQNVYIGLLHLTALGVNKLAHEPRTRLSVTGKSAILCVSCYSPMHAW